ncbi:MAG: gamma-glutamyltransferase [Pirellulales bacterium]
MTRLCLCPALFIALFITLLIATPMDVVCAQEAGRHSSSASGSQGAVAAGRPVSVDAGMQILKRGGNAIDAAVATLLAQTVTESSKFCFGGEVSILIYDARRDVVEVLSGQGTAPKLATFDYFLNYRNETIPGSDPAAAAVPAVLHVCLTALDRYGSLTFAQVAQPMLRALDRDEPRWSADLARTIRQVMQAEREAPDDRQRGLQLAQDYFYRGPVAHALDRWSRAHQGLIRYDDLAAHTTRFEVPVAIKYHGYTIYKCGPWTQGPYLLQTLRLLEGFDLKAMGHNSPQYVHVVVEAMKLALADRDTFYGDPQFIDVPLESLLMTKYAALRRPLIDLRRASHQQRPGNPHAMKPLLNVAPQDYKLAGKPDAASIPGGTIMRDVAATQAINDTTTCLVSDQWGNVVAATPSGWGGVLAGQTGVQLGSRLISLNSWKGHPNCIEPGKRPRITLTPTLVSKDGLPALAISVAGGDLQDQTTLQVLLNVIEFGMDPTAAVTAPRFSTAHHIGSFGQPPPQLGTLSIYDSVAASTIAELEQRGHKVHQVSGPIGQPVLLTFPTKERKKHVAGDPRADRHVAAY